MRRGCQADVIKLGGVLAVLCSVIFYHLGLQWVQQDQRHIAELFVAGVGVCFGVLLVYWLRAQHFQSPPERVSYKVLLLLVAGIAICVYSILYMQTAGWYWQPRIAGALAFVVYAVAGYVVWYRPYKRTAPEDPF